MQLEKLSLFNFKNYGEASLAFTSSINCFLGKNGSGKTNLLDAIHYLSFTKSFLQATDTQNIRLSQNGFSIKGTFSRDGRRCEVLTSFQVGQKKVVKEDQADCLRFSEHIGKYPVVLVAPQDMELIWDGGEVRRKFFDTLISQLDKKYLENLIIYTNALKQRNSALRSFSETGNIDYDLLDSYDALLAPSASYISNKRGAFIHTFQPRLISHYRFLSGDEAEEISVTYKSDIQQQNWPDLLRKNLSRDLALQRTTTGVHRDEFLFFLNGQELRRFGSQGQQKSFLVGLKLAEFEMIKEVKSLKPLLLLDDIFDKLDDIRIGKLMARVAENTFGQIFITDARPLRTKEMMDKVGLTSSSYLIESGQVHQQK
jgi:DNA replication and repair protein RecF